MNPQYPALRWQAGVIGVAFVGFAIGYVFDQTWATQTWPWADTPRSHAFVGAIMAAVAVAFVWIGVVGEWGALGAGALTVFVMCGGWASFLVTMMRGRPGLFPFAIFFAVVAMICVPAMIWSWRHPILDEREIPLLVRVSFAVFAGVLALAGTALVLRAHIFPWALNADSGVMFGWIFLGDACYFLSTLSRPRWHDARGQLLSFRAYDVVLIPLLLGLSYNLTLDPDHSLSLLLYLAVLLYSGSLAVYYLFIDPRTRGWAIQARGLQARGAAL